ncbi:MAG: TatD family hydrolase [Ignavibacteriaceae bacterium]|jgi:TatD DNase family protein
MFIDTHAHLFYPNYQDDLEKVLQNAKDEKVDYILVPATDLPTSIKVIELITKYDMLFGAVGIHPHDTKDWDDAMLTQLNELAQHKKVVAIGEIGLDYFYDFSPKEKQIEAFRKQLELAISLDLPVIIHNRDADEDIFAIVSEFSKLGLRGQFHCFSGTLKDAQQITDMNFSLSFTGNVTFKKTDELRAIASKIELKHLLLETDSPFMTPIPHRGKRNEPANIPLIAHKIAELHGVTIEDVGRITSFNALKLFGIGSKAETSFTYKLGNSLYLNITNRCNANCFFCDKDGDAVINGYNLKMKKSEEPPAETYINEIGDPTQYDEIVFCGYGEPTIRFEVVKQIAKYVKDNGGKTRLNTNGHGNIINKRNIIPEMNGLIDTVSISLNSSDETQYAEIMRVEKNHFAEMKNFASQAKTFVDKVVLTVVSIDEVEIEKARKLVEDEIGVEFRIRKYF